MAQIAKIAIENAVYAIDKPYDYLVPEDMTVCAGMRVTVPFGRGNRRSEGMVLSVQKMGGDALLEIAFDNVGTKRLMLKSAAAHMQKV